MHLQTTNVDEIIILGCFIFFYAATVYRIKMIIPLYLCKYVNDIFCIAVYTQYR